MMEKNRKRAYRRHNDQRALKHAKHIIQKTWFIDDPDWVNAISRRLRDHLKACSCPMCGNPRRHFDELTYAEQRAIDSARDAFEEYLMTLDD